MIKRIKRILANKTILHVLTILLALGVLLIVFTPKIDFFQKNAEFANQFLLMYLSLGMLFLLLSQKRLMVTSLLCAGALAFYLKETTNTRIKFSTPNLGDKYNISLINLSAIDADPKKVFTRIRNNAHDFLVFQEFTPDWKNLLSDQFNYLYPYTIFQPRIDFFGIAVMSKYPIVAKDTFFYEDIPILKYTVQKKTKQLSIITTYLSPPINADSKAKSAEQFKLLEQIISGTEGQMIVTGVFNLVPWSSEIQNFKTNTNLISSRNGYMPNINLFGGFLEKPVTYLLYREDLECIRYKTSKADNDEYGVEAVFQSKLQ